MIQKIQAVEHAGSTAAQPWNDQRPKCKCLQLLGIQIITLADANQICNTKLWQIITEEGTVLTWRND